ncbi:hypothetical protein DRJ25_02550 [Candidatus Woesearchaeota archaeon]|nr:MAG: hypothetical protein DRJ25_02550 [Candidatus Woesearchaeota archaeon]
MEWLKNEYKTNKLRVLIRKNSYKIIWNGVEWRQILILENNDFVLGILTYSETGDLREIRFDLYDKDFELFKTLIKDVERAIKKIKK